MGICQSQEQLGATAGAATTTVHATNAATVAKNKQDPYTNSKHRRTNNVNAKTKAKSKTKGGIHIVSASSSTPATVNMADTDHSSIEPVIEEDEDSSYDDDDADDDMNEQPVKASSPKSKQQKKLKKKKNSMWTPRTAMIDTSDDEGGLVSPPCPTLLFNNSNAGITSPLTPFDGNNCLSSVSESQSQSQQPLQQQQQQQQQQHPRTQLKRSSSRKKKKTQRRNSGRQRGFDGTPTFSVNSHGSNSNSNSIRSSSNSKSMTPLQLAPLGASMIPEEEDPTAPSDEEDFNDQLDLQQPGRLVPSWKTTGVLTPTTSQSLMSPLAVSWSYDDDGGDNNGMSSSALAAINLSPARSTMSPESYVAALELSRSAVKPKQYSNFQKLKLQVALHKQHSQKQAASIKKMDRQQDVQSYRELYHSFQEMQQELQQQQQETVDAAALAESVSVSVTTTTTKTTTTDDSLNKGGKKGKKVVSPRTKNRKKKAPTGPPDPPGTPPMKRTNSFNLKNSKSWYFDFQAPELHLDQSIAGSTVTVTAANTVAAIAADTEFAVGMHMDIDGDDDDDDDCSIVSRQSGLSLLSEATMDAQRRLYAEKRRERRRKKAGAASGAKSVTSSLLSSLPSAPPASTVTASRRDYGPVRRLSKSMQPEDTATAAPLTEMEVSFVHSLEDASSPYKQQLDPDDASILSDMGDDYSIASNNTGTNSNNDYRVPRRVRRTYNPDDAEVSRSPVKMSFSFDEGALAAASVLRSSSNPGSPTNRGSRSGGLGMSMGMGLTGQEPPSRISILGVAGASPLPHSQLMDRFDEAGSPSSPATKMVSSSVKSPMAAATTTTTTTTVSAATMMTVPRTLDNGMNGSQKHISESPVPGTSLSMEETATLDFLPRVQKDASTIKSSTAAAALEFVPRVQKDVMTTATADGRTDAQIPTAAAITPDKNSALLSIAKLKTMTLLADTGNASRDPLLEKDGSNLPPSTPTGASDSPAMVSPDWAHKIVESPIIATTKNMSSPVSPDSPQEDSFWESNTKSPESISTKQSNVQIEASPDKVKLVTDEELHCSPVDAAITAMSTEEFLRMAEDSKLGRHEYKSEFSSTESDSGASLLLAEEVEAQVKDVLTKYREYGDIYVAGVQAESLSESDVHDDELPRIISPERNSASH
jgi:hypothetical protein